MSRSSKRSSLRPGFTLLEVLAAVALLGILYTVLARVAIEALRAEGESQRRLEASLLADSALDESFLGGVGSVTIPEIGHTEKAEGDFTISMDVALFQPPAEWNLTESKETPPLLFASSPGAPGAAALRSVQITVSWLEGAEERHVSRTLFLVDSERAASLVATAAKSPRSPGSAQAPTSPELSDLPSELEAP
jgi:prepilin-type N-terminal cleavage/methylation domain-containing protein